MSKIERDDILVISNLKKNYGSIEAVKDVSFTVKKGSLFAFLGPNGAGKSTTIKMITTLLSKDNGEIKLNGISDEKYIREKIGVVFQDNVLDDILTVKENLVYRGSLYISNKKDVMLRYEVIKGKLNLEEIENRKFKNLSGGQKRKVEIARALFSNPEILLLDEPTTGLDPSARKEVWNIIDKLKSEQDITVFLTTHYMEEAANADYIVIIDKGNVKVSGTPSELKNKYSNDKMIITPKNQQKLQKTATDSRISYKKVSDTYIFELNNSLEAIEYIKMFEENIHSFEVIKGSLDDVFIKIIGEDNV